MANNLTPTVVKQTTFNTDEISRRADPEWMRERNLLTAYKFNRGPTGDKNDELLRQVCDCWNQAS